MEVLLDQNVTTSFSMPVVPSSGITAKRRRATYDFRAPIVKKKKAKPKETKTIIAMVRKTVEKIVDGRALIGSKAPWRVQRERKISIMWICKGYCGSMSMAYHSMLQPQGSLRLLVRPPHNMVRVTSL